MAESLNLSYSMSADLDDTQKSEFFDVFTECFKEPFSNVSKDETVLRMLFEKGLDKNACLVCLNNDKITGFICISDYKSRPLYIDKKILQKSIGKIYGAIKAFRINCEMLKPKVKKQNEGFIDYIGVTESYRGKGIGTELFNHIFDTNPFDTYYLEVHYLNKQAINLYKKVGFKIFKKHQGLAQKISGLICEYTMCRKSGKTV